MGRPCRRTAAELVRPDRVLTPEEMSHITGVCQQPEALSNGHQALADYIHIIQEEATKRAGGADIDPLLAATEKYRKTKITGGKHHD